MPGGRSSLRRGRWSASRAGDGTASPGLPSGVSARGTTGPGKSDGNGAGDPSAREPRPSPRSERQEIPGTRGLSALLGLTFAIAAFLVHEAWTSARSQRATTNRALQDYASYAAWSAARLGEAAVYQTLATLFGGLTPLQEGQATSLASVSALVERARFVAGCGCAVPIPAQLFFRVDLRDGRLTAVDSAGVSIPSPAWLREALPVTGGESGPFILRFVRHDDTASVVAFAPHRGGHGTIVGAVGFVADLEVFGAAIFAKLTASKPVLPSSVTGGLPNDSLLSVSVETSAGTPVYRSAVHGESAVSDTASMISWLSGSRIKVTLREAALGRLPIGPASVSRLPILLGLLVLTGGLVVVIVRHLRREHELVRLRSDFTASVSHELRTPLAQILLYGETLTYGRTRSHQERQGAAEVIVREARRLMHLVENALHFVRTDRRLAELRLEPIELPGAVRGILTSFAPLAWADAATLREDFDPEAAALMDPAALRQIVLNLLDNAVRYGPRGQTVTVSVKDRPADVRISVEDEGPGVDPSELERIWEPFVRGTRGRNQHSGGSGIGLAVVRDLAARHGGRAWAEPASAHRGARFTVEIPKQPIGAGREPEMR